MKKAIIACLMAVFGASVLRADFTKVQESFEDEWTYTVAAAGGWSSTDSAAAENITAVAYADENDGYAYDETEGATNVPAVDTWSGDNYLNLAKATNLTRTFSTDGTPVAADSESFVLDTLISFTAADSEDAPEPQADEKFLIWLEEEELESEKDGEVFYTYSTNLMIKCGNDTASATNEFTLVKNALSPVSAGKWTRLSVKAMPLYTDGSLGFVVYIDGVAVSAGESDETYQALFTDASKLSDSVKGYYELKQIFPSLTKDTSLTAVGFKGTGKVDDFQLVTAADQPAFIVSPFVVSYKGIIGDDNADFDGWTKDAEIVTEGTEVTDPGTPEAPQGYEFVGWYTLVDGEVTEATFPLTITATTTIYAKFKEGAVAKIGDTGYATLQDAVTAALEADSSTTPVQIDIIRDFTITDTITILGTGSNTTHIVFNNEASTVTFNMTKPGDPGFTIEDAFIVFKGQGSWSHETEETSAKTAFCVGEKGITVDGVTRLAPAFVVIEDGNYSSKMAHVFNVMNGVIKVNGGNFKAERSDNSAKCCIRAEDSDIQDSEKKILPGGSALVIVNGGTFEMPENNNQCAPVSVKKYAAVGAATVLVKARKEDGSLNDAPKFKGNEEALRKIQQLYLGTVAEMDGTAIKDSSEYALVKNADGYYTIGERVATIGEVGYGSLQNALDAAVTSSTADNEVTVNVVKDITITNTVVLTGKGIDATKVVINNGAVVTFDMTKPSDRGFTIDNVTVTFKGTGSWSHETKRDNPKTAFCVGEMGAEVDGVTQLAPAYVVIEEGNYSSKMAHVFNVQNGFIRVNGGNFKTEGTAGKCCIRAEDSEVKAADTTDAGAILVVAGGTFETPETSNTSEPVATPKGSKTAETHILVNATTKPIFKCSDVCFTDGAKFDPMDTYLSLYSKDESDEDCYTRTKDYKFVKGEDGYWSSTEITWVTVTIKWDDKVTSFVFNDGDEDETIDTMGKGAETQKYDIDDKASVKITTVMTSDAYYVLDETHSVLSANEITADLTLTIALRPNAESVSPEVAQTCDSEDAAKKLADAINAYPLAMITVPSEEISAADYVKLFTATVTGDATSGYVVTVVLTDAAKTNIQTKTDEIFKSEGVDLSTLATEDTALTLTAVPGLYYTVLSGTEVNDISTAAEPVLATGETVMLTFPKKGESGFYKVKASVTK